MGDITIDQAVAMFKDRIKAYVAPVQRLGRTLTQEQFDALVSFCYNVGPGNLETLCRNRSNAEIGEAFSLYHKPPEITARRDKEQKLFKTGVYSANGKVLVFPVNASHKPVYSKGYALDVAKYFTHTPAPAPSTPIPAPAPAAPGWLSALINFIVRLFKR
jgi:lysozyme